MSNDFPDSVFSSEHSPKRYCHKQNIADEAEATAGGGASCLSMASSNGRRSRDRRPNSPMPSP